MIMTSRPQTGHTMNLAASAAEVQGQRDAGNGRRAATALTASSRGTRDRPGTRGAVHSRGHARTTSRGVHAAAEGPAGRGSGGGAAADDDAEDTSTLTAMGGGVISATTPRPLLLVLKGLCIVLGRPPPRPAHMLREFPEKPQEAAAQPRSASHPTSAAQSVARHDDDGTGGGGAGSLAARKLSRTSAVSTVAAGAASFDGGGTRLPAVGSTATSAVPSRPGSASSSEWDDGTGGGDGDAPLFDLDPAALDAAAAKDADIAAEIAAADSGALAAAHKAAQAAGNPDGPVPLSMRVAHRLNQARHHRDPSSGGGGGGAGEGAHASALHASNKAGAGDDDDDESMVPLLTPEGCELCGRMSRLVVVGPECVGAPAAEGGGASAELSQKVKAMSATAFKRAVHKSEWYSLESSLSGGAARRAAKAAAANQGGHGHAGGGNGGGSGVGHGSPGRRGGAAAAEPAVGAVPLEEAPEFARALAAEVLPFKMVAYTPRVGGGHDDNGARGHTRGSTRSHTRGRRLSQSHPNPNPDRRGGRGGAAAAASLSPPHHGSHHSSHHPLKRHPRQWTDPDVTDSDRGLHDNEYMGSEMRFLPCCLVLCSRAPPPALLAYLRRPPYEQAVLGRQQHLALTLLLTDADLKTRSVVQHGIIAPLATAWLKALRSARKEASPLLDLADGGPVADLLGHAEELVHVTARSGVASSTRCLLRIADLTKLMVAAMRRVDDIAIGARATGQYPLADARLPPGVHTLAPILAGAQSGVQAPGGRDGRGAAGDATFITTAARAEGGHGDMDVDNYAFW